MIVADCLLAVFSFLARYQGNDSNITDMLGAIAIGGCVFLIIIPTVLRKVGRWASATDRLVWAGRCAGWREILQPGMGGGAEQELIQTVLAVRHGREEDVVAFPFWSGVGSRTHP